MPLLNSQNLLGCIYGSLHEPSESILSKSINIANPKHAIWKSEDLHLLILLLSSVIEEAMVEVLGLSTSHAVWTAFESSFCHRSKIHEIHLKDEPQHLKRGSRSVTEYSYSFKAFCDQLVAIGSPADDTDKIHWFLRGLGSEFANFSTIQLSISPLPSFRDLVSKAKSSEFFQKSLETPVLPSAAFAVTKGHFNQQQNRAANCPDRYAKSANFANVVETAYSCSSPHIAADWYTDTGAAAHMMLDSFQLDKVEPYNGKDCVIVGNGAFLPITHQNSPSSSIAPSISSCVPCTTDLVDDFVQHLSSEPTVTGVSLNETVVFPAVTEATYVASLPLDQPTLPSGAYTNLHSMITRAKAGVFKPKHLSYVTTLMPSSLVHALITTQEPHSFSSASKHPDWVIAMNEELDALSSNDTWDLVPCPLHTNIVGSKWIFHVKYLADDTVDREQKEGNYKTELLVYKDEDVLF
uniref:Uncharacterized protein n=1 Tax=Populus alba TaxID=43335 RepID=A0A4U5N9N2_POPAL|nr:hypothetical protein D5086_0000269580 [Populus alba]